jgi:hypothetical protein
MPLKNTQFKINQKRAKGSMLQSVEQDLKATKTDPPFKVPSGYSVSSEELTNFDPLKPSIKLKK